MPSIDLTFNGYRLDYRGNMQFDATQPLQSYKIPEGIYNVGDQSPLTGIFRHPGGSGSAYNYSPLRACSAVNQSTTKTYKYSLSPFVRQNFVCVGRYYLYFNNTTAMPGIQVSPAFFRCAKFYNPLGDLDGLTLKVHYSAPWMFTANAEKGEREVAGKRANPRILEYFKASHYWGTDDSGGENAWCASFVSWIMKENGYSLPAHAFRAKAWKDFGKKIASPVYGALGIKSRTGGGHVAFVVGKSEDGKYLYMLGGNQHDEVNVTRYNKNVWDTFVVPSNYDVSNESLPVYTQPAKNAGSES